MDDPADLAARVQALEVLTGFQERLMGELQGELLTFTRRVERLEAELRRLQDARRELEQQEPFDEDDRVPDCG